MRGSSIVARTLSLSLMRGNKTKKQKQASALHTSAVVLSRVLCSPRCEMRLAWIRRENVTVVKSAAQEHGTEISGTNLDSVPFDTGLLLAAVPCSRAVGFRKTLRLAQSSNFVEIHGTKKRATVNRIGLKLELL